MTTIELTTTTEPTLASVDQLLLGRLKAWASQPSDNIRRGEASRARDVLALLDQLTPVDQNVAPEPTTTQTFAIQHREPHWPHWQTIDTTTDLGEADRTCLDLANANRHHEYRVIVEEPAAADAPAAYESGTIVTTREGAIAYVETTISNRGQYPADFPVGDIVDALQEIAGCWHFENLDADEYWDTVDGIRKAQAEALRAHLASNVDTPAPTTWQECPTYHTTGASMAIKLRLIADALDTLGELASTWVNVGFQAEGTANPAGRKAAVDAIAEALKVGPAAGGNSDQYRVPGAFGVSVYTAQLHQPGCCEHCTVAGS